MVYLWIIYLVGGWATPLRNMSQLEWLCPIYGKIEHVPVTTNQITLENHHFDRGKSSNSVGHDFQFTKCSFPDCQAACHLRICYLKQCILTKIIHCKPPFSRRILSRLSPDLISARWGYSNSFMNHGMSISPVAESQDFLCCLEASSKGKYPTAFQQYLLLGWYSWASINHQSYCKGIGQ